MPNLFRHPLKRPPILFFFRWQSVFEGIPKQVRDDALNMIAGDFEALNNAVPCNDILGQECFSIISVSFHDESLPFPLVRFSTTFATTPLPNKINNAVPRNSATNGLIRLILEIKFTNLH